MNSAGGRTNFCLWRIPRASKLGLSKRESCQNIMDDMPVDIGKAEIPA